MKNDTKLWEKENRMGRTLTDKVKTRQGTAFTMNWVFSFVQGLLVLFTIFTHTYKSNAEKLRIESDSNYFNSFKE